MDRRYLLGSDVFEVQCDMIEVTSLSRPDTSWTLIDPAGHEHRWCGASGPAGCYNPSETYSVPTLVWVKDGEEWWEDDDEPHDVGHLECKECGHPVVPRYKSDDSAQYVPGLRRYRINGMDVSQVEFERKTVVATGHRAGMV